MSEESEKLLFETIEDAIDYGINRPYGEFDFSELYKLIESLEEYKWMYEDLCK